MPDYNMDTVLEEPRPTPKKEVKMKDTPCQEVTLLVPQDTHGNRNQMSKLSPPGSRRMTGDTAELQEVMNSRRNSFMSALRRPSQLLTNNRFVMDFLQANGSKQSLNNHNPKENEMAQFARMKNRKMGDDAISSALSALYAKLLVVLGIALPITEIISEAPTSFYQGFYLYLYVGSVAFVASMYTMHIRRRAVNNILKSYHDEEKANGTVKTQVIGSFYLRVGAIAFGIGSMVYSGLEFGQYFELKGEKNCRNFLIALTPASRMLLSLVQMQFIFINTKEFQMERHKVISRFGLMHMIATNLCEWLYVLVEETKHEIVHFSHKHFDNYEHLTQGGLSNDSMEDSLNETAHHIMRRATGHEIVVDCRRTNIMGSLVQNASPFLFPCTIEYSLICAVILYEMWKKIKTQSDILRSRRNSRKPSLVKSANHLSIDCARAHRGMFGGILVIVLTIICLIMYFVLADVPSYRPTAVYEVTVCEIILYSMTSAAVILAMFKMRDLKFSKKIGEHGIALDCTLLLLAQSGVYIYCMFSIIGCFFSINKGDGYGGEHGLVAEVFSLFQTSLQTLFIMNAWWRRCKGAQQNRIKPGRELVTFLLVANMAIWFINSLIKGQAAFRPSHLHFFGIWAWTIITHVSMPLAIFYRFHSTICLFEIWKTAYKVKSSDH